MLDEIYSIFSTEKQK